MKIFIEFLEVPFRIIMRTNLFMSCIILSIIPLCTTAQNSFFSYRKISLNSQTTSFDIPKNQPVFTSNHLNIELYDSISDMNIHIFQVEKKTEVEQTFWRPDTIHAYGSNFDHLYEVRFINDYNPQGLLNSYFSQIDENNTWTNSGLFTYTYDSNGNLLSEIVYLWDCDSWVLFSQYDCTYDSNNNLLTEMRQSFVEDNWVTDTFISYTYDSNNNILSQLIERKGFDLLEWTYTYDDNNNMLSHLVRTFRNDTWYSMTLCSYKYDSNNNLITRLTENGEESGWANSHLKIINYDSNNNQIQYLYMDWKNDEWENVEQASYTYDSNNNLLTTTYQMWRNHDWINRQKIVANYDANNNILSQIIQGWSENAWINARGFRIDYDANSNGISAERIVWDGTSWQLDYDIFLFSINRDLPVFYNNMQDMFWVDGYYQVTTSYREFNNKLGFEDVTKKDNYSMIVSPNPTTGQLHISNNEQTIQQISIYGLSGVQLFSIQETTPIDISHLTAGTYFVRIKTDNGIVTKIIIKM